MHKTFILISAVLGAVSVALGAFGAHALKETLPPQSLTTFETSVRYQFYHLFAIALCGILFKDHPVSLINTAGWLFVAGIILFCGSLYLLVSFPSLRWMGAITPLGGLCFIAGWLLLAAGVFKR